MIAPNAPKSQMITIVITIHEGDTIIFIVMVELEDISSENHERLYEILFQFHILQDK